LGQEDVESGRLITFFRVFTFLEHAHELGGKGYKNVDDTDPNTKRWCRIGGLNISAVPVFAVLFTISKDQLQSSITVLVVHLSAITVHDTHPCFDRCL
jgi:hypothetical protein